MRLMLLACAGALMLATAVRAGPIDDANAGLAALNQNDYRGAIRLLDRAIASRALARNDLEFAYLCRGKAYLGEGEVTRAVADLRRATRLKPDDADARQALADALSGGRGGRSSNYAGAAHVRESAAQAADDANAAMAALGQNDAAQAVMLFSRAIGSETLAPDDLEAAYAGRAKAYLQRGESARALGDLGKALRMNPDDREAQSALGQALGGIHAQNAVTPIDTATCRANWSSVGSWAAGKTYYVWASYPNLSTTEAFAGVYAYLTNPASAQYSGFNITRLDFEQATISATDQVPGSQAAANLDVKVEPDGAGSKISISEALSPFMISIDLQGALCNFLGAVARG